MFNKLNKKGLLSLFLAFAMVFSFVGYSTTAFADDSGPGTGNTVGVPTSSFELFTTTSGGSSTPITINESSYSLSINHYSVQKRNLTLPREFYTGYGVSLKTLILDNLPAGKTFSDFNGINITCNDAPVNLTGYISADALFGTSSAPLLYIPADPNESSVTVEPTLNFSSNSLITNDVNDLDQINSIRLFVGQENAADTNMPKCLKWVKSIELLFD